MPGMVRFREGAPVTWPGHVATHPVDPPGSDRRAGRRGDRARGGRAAQARRRPHRGRRPRGSPCGLPSSSSVATRRSRARSSAFDAGGGSDRAVSKDLHAALTAWKRALPRRRRRQPGHRRQPARGPGLPAARQRARDRERLKLDRRDHVGADHLRQHPSRTRRSSPPTTTRCAPTRTSAPAPSSSRSPGCSATTPARCSCSPPASEPTHRSGCVAGTADARERRNLARVDRPRCDVVVARGPDSVRQRPRGAAGSRARSARGGASRPSASVSTPGRARATLGDRPHDEALAAAHVAAREHAGARWS